MIALASAADQAPLILTVPGIDNSGPRHWQSIWERELDDCARVELGSWERPACGDPVIGSPLGAPPDVDFAPLDDPKSLFNSSLDGNACRAIDFAEGARIDEAGLKALFRAAAALNETRPRRR